MDLVREQAPPGFQARSLPFSERIKEMQMQKLMRNHLDFKMDKGDECKDDAKC